MFSFTWLCVLVSLVNISYGQYEIPPVTLEAYRPRGFRASIKADNLTELFAFHGKLNEKINQIEPGEFGEDVKSPVDGYFTYYNPNMELKINDEVHYWVFVQHKKLGYRRDAQVWKVTELRNPPGTECEASVTIISDRTKVCRNMTIFEDQFGGSSIDISKWIIEQYVPGRPDYEFVVYRPDENVTLVNDGNLVINPHLASDKDIEADPLDLTDGCTKTHTKDEPCLHKKYMLQNPVVSGRLVSKQSFTYADVEVNAKLPSGDWLYPELFKIEFIHGYLLNGQKHPQKLKLRIGILADHKVRPRSLNGDTWRFVLECRQSEIYLEDDNQNRLVIAYARGNKVLTGNDNVDIGGSLLFGGPMLNHREPKRSEKLSSTRINSGTFSDTFHTYRLRWSKQAIELYVDGKNYGLISSESIKSSGFVGSSPKQVRLVLGVGAGGINDFPNGYKSGINDKPWINRNTQQVKTFYANVNHWFPTWGSGGRLQVNYVKVTAL